MSVSWRKVAAIATKDLREVLANRMAWMPALVVPLVFVVLLPLGAILLPQHLPPPRPVPPDQLAKLQAILSPDLRAALQGLPAARQMGLILTGQVLAPMFLVLPMMLSILVGANAFVGEKERKTLEPLLYSAATDAEIFLGKTVASFVPAMTLAWGSFALYTVVLNASAWSFMHRVWFPTMIWWPLMLWLAPAVAALGMTVTVLVSSRVGTFMEANQMAGVLVLPLVALMASQLLGALALSVPVGLALGAAVWGIDVALLAVAIRRFARSRLMTRL